MAGVDDKIKNDYPLHYLIWNNDYLELAEAIKTNEVFEQFYLNLIFILNPIIG